jgi:hypothetical protein
MRGGTSGEQTAAGGAVVGIGFRRNQRNRLFGEPGQFILPYRATRAGPSVEPVAKFEAVSQKALVLGAVRSAVAHEYTGNWVVGCDDGWLAANDVLPVEVIRRSRRLAEAALRPWTPMFTHGDLQITHVFVEGDQVTGIIDWSEASQGDALYDLAHPHARAHEHLDGSARVEAERIRPPLWCAGQEARRFERNGWIWPLTPGSTGRRSEVGHRGNDLATHHLDWPDLVHADHPARCWSAHPGKRASAAG